MKPTIRINPALHHVKEVKEIDRIDELISLLKTGSWFAIAAYAEASSPCGYIFVLGQVL